MNRASAVPDEEVWPEEFWPERPYDFESQVAFDALGMLARDESATPLDRFEARIFQFIFSKIEGGIYRWKEDQRALELVLAALERCPKWGDFNELRELAKKPHD